MSSGADIMKTASGLVEAADKAADLSRGLMVRSDVGADLSVILTELRGWLVTIRSDAHLLGRACSGLPTSRPPRHVPAEDHKRAAAGDR